MHSEVGTFTDVLDEDVVGDFGDQDKGEEEVGMVGPNSIPLAATNVVRLFKETFSGDRVETEVVVEFEFIGDVGGEFDGEKMAMLGPEVHDG